MNGKVSMTVIEMALSDVKSIAINTAPFIYFVERHPDYIFGDAGTKN